MGVGQWHIRDSMFSNWHMRGYLFRNEWIFWQGVTNLVIYGRCLNGVLHLVNYLDNGYEKIKITKVNVYESLVQWNNFIQKRNMDYLKEKGKLILYFFYLFSVTRAIMTKRSIEETINRDSNSEFKYDDSENQLRKKIKLEN